MYGASPATAAPQIQCCGEINDFPHIYGFLQKSLKIVRQVIGMPPRKGCDEIRWIDSAGPNTEIASE